MAKTAKSATRGALFSGVGISEKIVFGELKFLHKASYVRKTEDKKPDRVSSKLDPYAEAERMRDALSRAKDELSRTYREALERVGEEGARIFEIHSMLIEDEDFCEPLYDAIAGGEDCESALSRVVEKYCAALLELNDEYLSGRSADLHDIEKRILRLLGSETDEDEGGSLFDDDAPVILVADDLSPSETVTLDKKKILGFVTFGGSPSSHTAILARSMGLPALVEVGDIESAFDGAYAILDSIDGKLIISPDEYQLAEYSEKKRASDEVFEKERKYLRSLLGRVAQTKSGHKMAVYANIGEADETDAALEGGADGIGLLRSEFLYLFSRDYPSEQTLYESYAAVVKKMAPRRVVIRTLDIGADKKIDYFSLPKEENPALGFRAIRICLERRELFKTQLRAILRASAHGNCALMLPMIVLPEEVKVSREILEECKRELEHEGLPFGRDIELGIMIETPASALLASELASLCDFFSVGTNDLIQYTLAADRQNPSLSSLCERGRAPVLKLIRMAADAIHARGKKIGICGEMATDMSLTKHFADIGIDYLSVSPPYLLAIRGKIVSI